MFKKNTLQSLGYIATLLSFTFTGYCAMAQNLSSEDQIVKFQQSMVAKYQFDQKNIQKLFSHFKPNQVILERINKPYEAKPWPVYRDFFITTSRIEQGNAYWKSHEKLLSQAEQTYGVPARIIVAILGVESFYGQHVGKYPVFNSLATLSFYYPKRSRFFQKELSNLLLLSREQGHTVTDFKGSYAGAIGFAQFMPSSIRHYGISASKNKYVNLNQDDDAILSIANYLKENGWRRGEAIAQPVVVKKTFKPSFISNNVSRFYDKTALYHEGLITKLKENRAAIFYLPKNNKDQAWAGFNNFKSIMRYNPRTPYAMAVFQLSQALKKPVSK